MAHEVGETSGGTDRRSTIHLYWPPPGPPQDPHIEAALFATAPDGRPATGGRSNHHYCASWEGMAFHPAPRVGRSRAGEPGRSFGQKLSSDILPLSRLCAGRHHFAEQGGKQAGSGTHREEIDDSR